MKEADELLAIAEGAMRAAMRAGAETAEAFVRETRQMGLACHGRIAQPTESHSIGIGVRVLVGNALGVAATAGLHRTDEVVRDAVEAARTTAAGRFPGLPHPTETTLPPTPVPAAFLHPDPEPLQDLAQVTMEATTHPRVDFHSFSITRGATRFAIVSSLGLSAWDQGGRESIQFEVRSTAVGRAVTAWEQLSSTAPHRTEQVQAPALAARERIVHALDAAPLDRPVTTVVLAPNATAQLVTRFLRTFSGALVATGSSPVGPMLGTAVAAPDVTIHDVPHGRGPQRRRVDDEGVPTWPLALVEEGVARATYEDTASGADRGGSTGHGVRKGWSGSVSPGLMMPEMRAGPESWDSLIQGADDAVLIEEPLTGMLTANLATGAFSAVLPYAYRIRGGEVTHALPNVTVSGNVFEVMRRIEAIGSEVQETMLGFFPAMRAGGVTCAT